MAWLDVSLPPLCPEHRRDFAESHHEQRDVGSALERLVSVEFFVFVFYLNGYIWLQFLALLNEWWFG